MEAVSDARVRSVRRGPGDRSTRCRRGLVVGFRGRPASDRCLASLSLRCAGGSGGTRATRKAGSSMASMSEDVRRPGARRLPAATRPRGGPWSTGSPPWCGRSPVLSASESSDAADVSQVTWLRLVEHLDGINDPDRVGRLAGDDRQAGMPRRHPPSGPLGHPGQRRRGVRPACGRRSLAGARRWWPPSATSSCGSALGELSERCQRLLRVLMADPPPPYDAVSAALDMPIGSIGPTRARCLAHLRRHLADGGITGEPFALWSRRTT